MSRWSRWVGVPAAAAALAALAVSVVGAQERKMPDIMAPAAGSVQTTTRSTQPGSTAAPATSVARPASTTVTTGQGTGTAVSQPQSDLMPLATAEEIRVNGQVTERVKARFADAVRAEADIRDKVMLNGTIRTEDAPPLKPGEARKRAVVTWTAVTREDGVSRREVLPSPLVTSFTTGDPVPAGQVVNAKGDVAGALNAARNLLAQPAQQQAGQKPVQQTTGGQTVQADTGKKPTTAAGDGASENSILRSLQPKMLGSAEAAAAAPEDLIGETSEGCEPRIDLQQAVAIVQSRTTRNGSPEGQCSDTLTRYPVQKSYSVCQDSVDLAAKKAYPQYKLYYVNGEGSTTYLSTECEKDAEQAFDLVEDEASCTIETDLLALQAWRRAETVYTNKSNQRTVVASCHRVADAQAITMTAAADGCSPRLDMPALTAHEKKKTTFSHNGLTYTAQDCSETGTTFAVVEDRSVCSPLVDQQAGKAWPQRRFKYTDGGGNLNWADSGCAPVTGEVTDLVKTRSGCEGGYTHDVAGGQSWAHSRWYYNLGGGPTYVTSCGQDLAIPFTHQIRIAGYEHNDTTRTSKPKTEIYFSDAGQEVIASAAQVRAGSPDLPYSLVEAGRTVPTGTSTYDGCDAFRETAVSDVYARPDGTEYVHASGAGTPTGPHYVCTTQKWEYRTIYNYAAAQSTWQESCQSTYWTAIQSSPQRQEIKVNSENGDLFPGSWIADGSGTSSLYECYSQLSGKWCAARNGSDQATVCASGTF